MNSSVLASSARNWLDVSIEFSETEIASVNKLCIFFIALLPLVSVELTARAQQTQGAENVDGYTAINHDDYDRLLKKYVNEQGLVNYGAWKQNRPDVTALEDYLKQFAQKSDKPAQANEKAASLVNAYNAFMLRWILSNYPTESVWSLRDSFTAQRNDIGGRRVSFDDIEHGALRPLIGYRAHAVLVCAARSCPPLQRFAYAGDKFEEQDVQAYRAWLAREDLNRFMPSENRVEISSIFKWFKQDFDKVGGIPQILGRCAPEPVQKFAGTGNYETKYISYNWGLNDQGLHGRNYSRVRLLFDNIFK